MDAHKDLCSGGGWLDMMRGGMTQGWTGPFDKLEAALAHAVA